MNSADEGKRPVHPDDANIHPSIGVPKKVAWAMGAGLLGMVMGGALVGFTAAVAVPAIRDRIRRRGKE